jgi:hypothetical protein
MYFSVGGHLRFACLPGRPDAGKFSDCFLEFEEPESPESIIKTYGSLELIEASLL